MIAGPMSKIEQGTVPTHEGGIRLDLWLVAHTSISSRSKARKAIASGKVAVGDDRMGTADSGRLLAAGDKVELDWGRSGNANGAVRLARAGVQLLYVDEAIAVANKPAGLLTDTATYKQLRERDSLRKQLRSHLGSQVWPAHRIDRDTTGVVVFARSKELFESMREQWYARTPERVYVAVLEGRVKEDEGRWADWMAWDAKAKLQKPSKEGQPHAVLAEADWRVLSRGKQVTAVEVRLVSGRRNQIRVHAMLRDHPLVGEVQYRRGRPRFKGASRQALHALRLGFVHPITEEPVSFEAPLPADLQRLLRM